MGKRAKKAAGRGKTASKAKSASPAEREAQSQSQGERFVIDGEVFDVQVLATSGARAEVSVNGTRYAVQRPAPSARSTRAAGGSVMAARSARAASAAPSSAGDVRAPMAGKVLSISKGVGGSVRRGEALVVLDAMKMENTIAAASDGEVAEVAVAPGDTVLQGALLVRLR